MDPASGGPCEGIRNSIPELEKLGVYNEVVSLDDPQASFLGKDPFMITALGPGKGPWCYSENLLPWLIKNFERFDAVIVHGLWLYNSYAANKAIKQLGRKRVTGSNIPKLFVMPHGMLDPYFQRASGRKLKAIRNWAFWKIIEGKLINNADAVLFTTETELQLAREPFRPYKPKKEVNVGYGIKTPPAFPSLTKHTFFERFPALDKAPYFLFLSRIHDKKGVDLLVEAYASLISKRAKLAKAKPVPAGFSDEHSFEDESFPKLVIAGPGLETAYGQKIKQSVESSDQLKDAIIFPGMLLGEEKWDAFYNCEAFILPSHQENFGIAVAEALACGKPVLISDQVNIWREIERERAGIVAKDDLEGTSTLLERWQQLPASEKLEMSINAKNCFEKNFAIAPAARNFLKALSYKNI
jgi:glycosyltransferase involved in cell wall biosynthesis